MASNSAFSIVCRSIIPAALLGVLVGFPACAEKTAVAKTIKTGYFNLTMARASCPAFVGYDSLKANAEEQLRREFEDANKRLQKANEEKKPQEELQKLVTEIQVSLSAKRQALSQLVQTASAQANEKIFIAVAQVAKEKGLDLVVDGAGVYYGGQGLLDSGEDVTMDVLKRLSPISQIAVGKSETKSAPAAAQASAAEAKSK